MHVPDALVIVLLLLAFLASAGAHYRTNLRPEAAVIGAAFIVAVVALLGVFAILAASVFWPDWPARGPVFLSMALLALGAAAFLWRDKLTPIRKATD